MIPAGRELGWLSRCLFMFRWDLPLQWEDLRMPRCQDGSGHGCSR